MKTLKVLIEKDEKNYCAYIENIDGIVATGKTIDEIKINMVEAIESFKKECQEFGGEIPEELRSDYDLRWA